MKGTGTVRRTICGRPVKSDDMVLVGSDIAFDADAVGSVDDDVTYV